MPGYCINTNAFLGGGPGSLFQQASFFRLHAAGQGLFFEWAQGMRVCASVHFTPTGEGTWRSPARGTFAGFAFDTSLRYEDLFAFHDAVELALKAEGARQLEILPPPMAHDPAAFANQFYLLRSRGYEMTHCDLNQSLHVDSSSLSDRMSYGNQKRLRKCQREGLVAERLPLTALADVYDTLAANRARKGYAMSMTLAQLQTMADTFPDAVLLFGSRDGERLAASAVCLRLSPTVVYVYSWGDRPGYDAYSPVVALAVAIYELCQTQKVTQLDVGASTLDRAPNFGLIQFKRGLGFTESLKVRMSKVL